MILIRTLDLYAAMRNEGFVVDSVDDLLIRQIEIQLRNLIGNGFVILPFLTEKEKDIENISMFTLPFFETYGMRINYD